MVNLIRLKVGIKTGNKNYWYLQVASRHPIAIISEPLTTII